MGCLHTDRILLVLLTMRNSEESGLVKSDRMEYTRSWVRIGLFGLYHLIRRYSGVGLIAGEAHIEKEAYFR